MKTLKGTKDIQAYCKTLPHDVIALAVCAYDRFGLHEFLSRYHILAMRHTTDIAKMRQFCSVHAMETAQQSQHKPKYKKMSHAEILHDPEAQKLIDKLKHPLLITPQASPDTEGLIRSHGWKHLAPPASLVQDFENKKTFRALLTSLKLPFPKTILATPKTMSYTKAKQTLGVPFIVQAAASRGGRGTFLVKDETDMRRVMGRSEKTTDMVISRLIDAHPVSTTAVATQWGIFSSTLQYQIIDTTSPKTFGDFLGHDWSFANTLPASLHKKAMSMTKRIGQAMYKRGFRGFFGLDFLIDKKTSELFVLECNPRFTGALPTLELVQARLNRPFFCSLHVLEFVADLYKDFRLEAAPLQKIMGQARTGSHVHITSPHAYASFVTCPFKPGTYFLGQGRLRYQSSNIELKNLRDKNQIIITQLLPSGGYTPAHGHVCRILSHEGMLDKKGHLTARILQLLDHIDKATEYVKA